MAALYSSSILEDKDEKESLIPDQEGLGVLPSLPAQSKYAPRLRAAVSRLRVLRSISSGFERGYDWNRKGSGSE